MPQDAYQKSNELFDALEELVNKIDDGVKLMRFVKSAMEQAEIQHDALINAKFFPDEIEKWMGVARLAEDEVDALEINIDNVARNLPTTMKDTFYELYDQYKSEMSKTW